MYLEHGSYNTGTSIIYCRHYIGLHHAYQPVTCMLDKGYQGTAVNILGVWPSFSFSHIWAPNEMCFKFLSVCMRLLDVFFCLFVL